MFCLVINLFIATLLIDKTYCLSNNFIRLKIIDELWSKEDHDFYPLEENLAPKTRRFESVDTYREKIKISKLSKKQHAHKLKVIKDFIKDHYLTTNYFYKEVLRIKKTRQVKDELRKMIDYLEEKGEQKIKDQVLKCYAQARLNEVKPVDLWKPKTNNLVINVLRDPFNDGFIN